MSDGDAGVLLGDLLAAPLPFQSTLVGPAAGGVDGHGRSLGVAIGGLAYDSRAVHGGELFFCVPGFSSDGHEFAAAALDAGAAALVVERELDLLAPQVLVPSARAAMAPLAARFYRHPSRELTVVAVTGTNGKTTTSYLVRSLLEAIPSPPGGRCGLLGTIKSVVGGRERAVTRTTPEAIDLQGDLRAMVDAGDRACSMEVSSHALSLGRAEEIAFAAAIFTNLTQDHLDFHPTMEDYFEAKRRLFLPARGAPPRVAVVNAGDPYGSRLAAELPGAVTFAVERPADYSASELRCDFEGCRFALTARGVQRELALPMPGRFNVANALAALAAVHSLGGELETLCEALEGGVRVPGRFEPVEEGQPFAVLVDYAHTPDSLENVLQAARALAGPGRRVISVFGAGGGRDRGKRPLMGEIGARLSDLAIVTSDNPRSEDPETIIAQILAGARSASGGELRSLGDRREAIFAAIADARAGDVVVIAGKGHEQGQELADARKVPFDDVSVAREALAGLTPASVGGSALGGSAL